MDPDCAAAADGQEQLPEHATVAVFGAVDTVLIANTFLSLDPTNTVAPSGLRTGDEPLPLVNVQFHRRAPDAVLIAYTESYGEVCFTTNTVAPSGLVTGDE
jgi:hypothetical protein